MRKLRTCTSAQLYTGTSKCQPEWGKMKGALILEKGQKLPAKLTLEELEKLVHADAPNRVCGVATFAEYAKNGGEVQTSANGYGGEEVTGISARKDTYTLNKFYPELAKSLTNTYSKEYDVYFFDENNVLYGIDDDTDTLAGYPMSSVYADETPHPTSSAASTMTVTFSHADAKLAVTGFDYIQLDFNPLKAVLGLVPVRLEKSGNTSYKLYEVTGHYDVTAIYGPAIAEKASAVIGGTTSAVTYNEADETLTITGEDEPRLKAPSVLYENDIVGIVGV